MIHVRMLGAVELTVDGAPAPPELLWRKNLALLAYLLRNSRRPVSREQLLGLLWADKPETRARRSLNVALSTPRFLGDDASKPIDQVGPPRHGVVRPRRVQAHTPPGAREPSR
jgi:DNA-binding SARP family transcriptional activator